MANPILRLYIDGEQKVKVKPDTVQTIYSDFQYNFTASGSTVVEQNGKDVIIYSAVPDTALEFYPSGSTQIERDNNKITIYSPSVDTSTLLTIEDFNQYVLDLNINQYITDAEMETILQTLNSKIEAKTSVLDVENIVNTYLTNYYTKAEIDFIIANINTISSWKELTDIPIWLNNTTLNEFESNHTHDYSSLRGKPTIPTLLSQLTNDSNFITINDIPTIPSDISELTDNTNLLFDKEYNSLNNKPTIPTRTSDLTNDSNYINDLSSHSATELSDILSVGSGNIITSAERTKLNNALITADKGDTVATLDVNQKLVQDVDASKITSGTIDIQRLPAGALERLIEVNDETQRFSLTINDVQNGDTVKQLDTGVMYRVVDNLNLNNSLGYKEYVAGRAAAVDWSGVENKPSFHAVATSGSYNDLLNKPTIPSDVNELTDASNLLFDGNYNSLSNKPTIPTSTSQLLNDSGYITISDIPTIPTDVNQLNDASGLFFDKDYNSLTNKPTIPNDISELSDNSNLLFDGNYNSLSNKPTIPTRTSDLLNDSGYITISDLPTIPSDISDLSDNSNLLFDKNYNSLTNKPTLGSIAPYNIWNGTQAQYDALGTYSDNTIYLIDEE